MLGNPLHSFSGYQSVSVADMLPPVNGAPGHTFADGAHYFTQNSYEHTAPQPGKRQGDFTQSPKTGQAQNRKQRLHPYDEPAAADRARTTSFGAEGSSGPVRRRISRACDQCNQLRTKCDGQAPCAHCVEFGLGCEYVRERKKRGKASRKDLARQAATTVVRQGAEDSPSPSDGRSPREKRTSSAGSLSNGNEQFHGETRSDNRNPVHAMADSSAQESNVGQFRAADNEFETAQPFLQQYDDTIPREDTEDPADIGLSYGAMQGFGNRVNNQLQDHSSNYMHSGNLPGYAELPYTIPSPLSYPGNSQSQPFRLGDSPLPSFSMGTPGAPSPGWASMPSPIYHLTQLQATSGLRYPVLQPLIPHLGSILPLTLASDLLDIYFASSTSAQLHPLSPYVLGFVFRKQSFLHPTKPRQCSPALLASMLWVAAQTSDASFLTVPPSKRGKVCQRLLELTVCLLKPLIHSPTAGDVSPNFADTVINGVALGGLGVSLPGTVSIETMSGESGAFGAAGALDDVVTYIHLATVVSASEYKGASLRWWNAAWSLARELKLGKELPPSPATQVGDNTDGDADETMGNKHPPSYTPGIISEEEREERRRIWWLVYIVDRHLSLCYNKPLFLLDAECNGLFQPMDEGAWQAGSLGPHSPGNSPSSPRRRGPSYECTGDSIFGYFLPLMTILGEIVDLNHAKNHPRFGTRFRSVREWDAHAAEIAAHLDVYERSGPPAYGTHVMHVLHILLTGKWDPLELLDDTDLWISSTSFMAATGHAVSAAEAIEDILDLDPGLEYMPFFFGVYLLQGSFLLLLIADKLRSEASPSVVRACETIVRAHEACVATLSTEYQRNFRKVMRSALAQVRGRVPEDFGEQEEKRREVLSLYRWTGDGTGLAL